MKESIITLAIGLSLGYIVYKLIDQKEKSLKSKFSSACGSCGA